MPESYRSTCLQVHYSKTSVAYVHGLIACYGLEAYGSVWILHSMWIGCGDGFLLLTYGLKRGDIVGVKGVPGTRISVIHLRSQT